MPCSANSEYWFTSFYLIGRATSPRRTNSSGRPAGMRRLKRSEDAIRRQINAITTFDYAIALHRVGREPDGADYAYFARVD
jgi:hypothetical protein